MAIKITERRAKYLGTDEATKHEHKVEQVSKDEFLTYLQGYNDAYKAKDKEPTE